MADVQRSEDHTAKVSSSGDSGRQATVTSDSSRSSMSISWRFRRLWNHTRCGIGWHRLRAYRDLGDGVNVDPAMPVHALPGPKDFRKCEWCGARWRGAYDGIRPFWQRVA